MTPNRRQLQHSRRRPCIWVPLALMLLGSLMLLQHAEALSQREGVRKVAAIQDQVPRFEWSTCPVEAPPSVECGYLVVPENRAQPEGRTIRLAVAILRSPRGEPAPDPVVYLEGGPGGSALDGLDHWLTSPFLADRDLILLEQRGTEYSEPALNCPELANTYIDAWVAGLSDEEEVARELEAAIECRDRLRSEGIDLSAYNSAASAADLDDLRQALGYDEWNLYGISYGTRLALTAMRDKPDGIRSVVLDSVYPPPIDGYVNLPDNTERVFNQLFGDCEADPACQTAYPTLEADLYELIDLANSQPLIVPAEHPETGEKLDLPVDGDDLVGEFFLAFYDESLIPYLPLIIDQAHKGNATILTPLTDFSLQVTLSGSDGMHNSVQCYEEAPFNSREAIAQAMQAIPPALQAFTITGTLETCEIWGAGTPPAVENAPVSSEIPTLVLEGQYDPITPPSYGRIAAKTLANSLYYEFPGMGHGVSTAGCPGRIAADFVSDPSSEPDTSCMDEMDSLKFARPDSLYLTPSAYRLIIALFSEESPHPFILLALADLFFLMLVYVSLYGLLRLLHCWPGAVASTDGLFHALLGAVAALNLIFLASMALLILWTILDDASQLYFGLPRVAPFLKLFPFLAAVAAAGLVIWLIVAWIRKYWSLARRSLYSLLVLVLLAYLWYVGYWGLLGF